MAMSNVNFPSYRDACDALDEWEVRYLRALDRSHEATIQQDFYRVDLIDDELTALDVQGQLLQAAYTVCLRGVNFDRGVVLSIGSCIRALRRAMDHRGYLHVQGDDLEGFEGFFYRYRIANGVRRPAQRGIDQVAAEWSRVISLYQNVQILLLNQNKAPIVLVALLWDRVILFLCNNRSLQSDKALELYESLGSHTVQYREVQGQVTEEFLSYFIPFHHLN
ncbi:hypothetical protein RHGRI_018278 [Rhododendron griersonianum]|uniref:Uncharacterized protein n=1 Tax=Rhododendron griersonianum TaxID=479676 RepID=A0AAV6K0Y5_9ERIC|nr:hypothetical protein RHGRI_018278 [Rhododendron griersonianum]